MQGESSDDAGLLLILGIDGMFNSGSSQVRAGKEIWRRIGGCDSAFCLVSPFYAVTQSNLCASVIKASRPIHAPGQLSSTQLDMRVRVEF